jgi:hypothetical protein
LAQARHVRLYPWGKGLRAEGARGRWRDYTFGRLDSLRMRSR